MRAAMDDRGQRPITLARSTVERTVADRLRAAGYDTFAAEQTADHLLSAEQDGCTSHGLQLVPEYLSEIADGRVDPSATVTVTDDSGTQLVFDAHAAPGHGALATVVRMCVTRAEDTGVVVSWTSSLAHVGRLAYYVAPAVVQPCLMLLSVNSLLDPMSALVAPPGSGERVLGSNPMAVGISFPDGAMAVYDGSGAAIPFYRLLEYHRRHERLPAGSLVTERGDPTDDPQEFFDGGAIPAAGGHRGFGLSLMMSLLCLARVPLPSRGASNAFLVMAMTDAMPDLRSAISHLRDIGVYVPGTRMVRNNHHADSSVELRPEILAMLRDNGMALL